MWVDAPAAVCRGIGGGGSNGQRRMAESEDDRRRERAPWDFVVGALPLVGKDEGLNGLFR